MKRVFRVAFTLLGTITFLVAGLVEVLSLRPAPPFYVAFVEREGARQVVYLARTDGEDVHALTAPYQDSWSPAWSPDGNRLVVLSDDDRTNMQLIFLDSQQGATSTTLAQQRFVLSPSWSPDGEWIAFSAFRGGQHSVIRANVETHRLQQLTDEHGNDFYPTWSPDGQWLAFASDRDHQRGNDVYRITSDNAAEPRPERLTYAPNNHKSSLQWSPDGRRIAFIVRDEDAQRFLYTLQVNSGKLREITEVYAPVQDWQLSWSGDGKWLYILKERNGEPIWYRIQPDSGRLEPLPGMDGFQSPVWSPIEERSRIGLRIALIAGTVVCSLLWFLRARPGFSGQAHDGTVIAGPTKPHQSLLTNP